MITFLPANNSILQSFSPEDLEVLRAIATEKEIEEGATVIREGESCQSIFLILSGSVDVLKDGTIGDISPISHLAVGDLFGEMGFVERTPATAHIIAREGTLLLEFPSIALRELSAEDSDFGMKLYQALSSSISQKLRKTSQDLLGQVLSSRLIEVGQLSLSIGHEINTPLASLCLKLDQLENQLSNQEMDQVELVLDIAECRATVERIVKIVRGLNLMGRDAQRDPLAKTDLKDLVLETIEFCGQRLKEKNIRLEVESFPAGVSISCRPIQISQVIVNLINNANDAIAKLEEKWIRITAEISSETVSLSITDSGRAIPADVRKKMFHPFFTTKPPGEGTGLGLSISRKMIRDHGGDLLLDTGSTNTCFKIILPKL